MNRCFYVISNANAGRARAGAQIRLHDYFEARGLPAAFSTVDGCDWDAVADSIAHYDEVRFVVAAGDGTLRLVLETLWSRNLLEKCTVAFVPLGSANVAALSLGLPRTFEGALELAVSGTARRVDLGLLNNRHVFFIAAIFGAISSVTVGARREWKERFGALAYLFSVNRLLKQDYRDGGFTFSVEDGGRSRRIRSHSMVVCNHLNIGMLRPSRRILFDDKRLDLITLHNTRAWGLARAAYDFFRGRRDSRVLRHRRITNAVCRLEGFKGHVHLDGDELTLGNERLDLRVMPHAARFVTWTSPAH